MKLSPRELSRHDLNYVTAEILNDNSNGLMSIEDFAQTWKARAGSRSRSVSRGYALGLSSVDEMELTPYYHAACEAFNLTDFKTAINTFDLCFNSEVLTPAVVTSFTRELFENLADKKLPTVFFIPPEVTRHYLAKVTKTEFEMAVDNPDLIHNFYFVLGLYDVKPKSSFPIPNILRGKQFTQSSIVKELQTLS